MEQSDSVSETETPTTEAFVDEATRFLMKESSAGGPTLHEHLTQVLLKLIVERPDDANSQFENISLSLRQLPTSILEEAAAASKAAEVASGEEEVKEDGETPAAAVETAPSAADVARKTIAAWCESHKHLFPDPPIPENEEEPEEEVEEPDPQLPGQVSSVLDDATLWQTAGVGFGDEQTFRLFRSLQILAGREGEECVINFWGKVVARSGAYFIAYALTEQTTAPDPLEVNDETEEKDGFMLPGIKEYDAEGVDGPNRYTYWASLDPSGDKNSWTKLPHVTPAQIKVARNHRRFFTGDLAAPVPCFPPLPGNTEAHLLRAVIAEITADCHLNLAGLMEPDDDAASEDPPVLKVRPVEEEDEESLKTFTLAELKMPEAWVHSEIDIKSNGRCQLKPVPEDEEPEELDLEGKRLVFFAPPTNKNDADVKDYKPVLRSIGEDVDENNKAEWVLRTTPSAAAAGRSAIVIAKSLKWPGAVSVASVSSLQPRVSITRAEELLTYTWASGS
jgi:radial spoke head protein 4A